MSGSPHKEVLPHGRFSNGVSAAAVVQLILDHDEAARIEDVADYFELEIEDVVAAIADCSRHLDRLRAEGWLIQ